MSAEELVFRSIAELSKLIEHKELSPVEVCEAYLDRVARTDGELNCFITHTAADALEVARGAEREIRAGRCRGPLHGIPMAIKDNFATAGIRTTAGSKLLKDWVPRQDAAIVECLKRAGAVLLGKLNMHEFAYGGTTINPHFGATLNPWNRNYTPGGSSGGSGAAVAAGLCAASLGTDGAGSVRYPAAACGIVGLKPTFGRVSRYGQVPGPQSSVDHVGPLTRSVEDAAIVLRQVAGHDGRDPSSARVPVPDYLSMLTGDVKGKRIGIPRERFAPVSSEVDQALQRAVATLEGLGALVTEVQLPHAKVEFAAAIEWPILMAEGHATTLHELLRRHKASLGDIGEDILGAYILARIMPAYMYVDAQKARRILIREFDEALKQVDVIVAPMQPVPGQTLAEGKAGLINIDGNAVDDLSAAMAFGIVYNLTGMPAITVPCGFAKAGVPIGMQIAGRPFDEATVFNVAYAYEQATSWHRQRPPI